MDAAVRKRKITETSVIGIIANVFLSAFKAFVGLISGSVAVILDAVNNLTDALSSVITIIGVKLAGRKPDDKHPFGHGRLEYFTTIIISVIVLSAGISSLWESIKKIISPIKPDFKISSIIIIVVAVIVKLLLGYFVKNRGVKYNSDALVASGKDATFDAIISASTLLSAVAALVFNVGIDGYLGVIISVFIIKSGFEMLIEGISSVLGGRADSETTIAIKRDINSIPGVLGAYDLILHNYGPDSAIGSIHIEISDTMAAGEIHKLTRQIQSLIYEKYKIFLTVGVYAIDSVHTKEREEIAKLALTHEGVLGTHGIYFDEEARLLSLDVLVDFSVKDRVGLCKVLTEEISKLIPGYKIIINFDANYSD